MIANQIIAKLEAVEVNSAYDRQTRDMMQAERFALIAAVRRQDRQAITAAVAEARRVAAMWSVTL